MGRCAEQAESSRWAIPTGTVKYQDLLCTEAEKGTAAIKGYGSELNDEPNSKLRYTSIIVETEELFV